jgi:hypothetical protein
MQYLQSGSALPLMVFEIDFFNSDSNVLAN